MTGHEAMAWLRRQLPGQVKQVPMGVAFRPSTPSLRRVLGDRRTPRAVKGHVYQWLRYRRAASRRRRHPYAA